MYFKPITNEFEPQKLTRLHDDIDVTQKTHVYFLITCLYFYISYYFKPKTNKILPQEQAKMQYEVTVS